MKRILISLAVIASLAACGGGSSGGSVATPPTTQPPTTQYSVRVQFNGGTSLHTTQTASNGAKVTTVHVLAATSSGQLPAEMSVAPPQGTYLQGVGSFGGDAQVNVSPQPSSSPAVTLTNSSSIAVLVGATPFPSGANGSPTFSLTAQGNTPSSGTLIANVGGPVNATQTVPTYLIPQTIIACGNRKVPATASNTQPFAGDQIGAVQFTNGTAVAVTDPTKADVYADGPKCTAVGTLNAAESEMTLHFPYGAVSLSSSTTPFAMLAATSWSNAVTSITFTQLQSGVTAVANQQDEWLVKTADGHYVKFAPLSLSNTGAQDLIVLAPVFEESGFSVDGF